MKRLCKPCSLLLIGLLILASCNIGGTNYTVQWTLSGEITLSGFIDNNVKIAVFYLGQDFSIDDTKPLVSDVVDGESDTV